MNSCGSASPSIAVRSDLPRGEPLHAEGELRHADAERDARAAGAEAVQRLAGARRRSRSSRSRSSRRRPCGRGPPRRRRRPRGSRAAVAPSSTASCRRPATGSTTTIARDAERPRRHHRRQPHAARAEHDERGALVELEHVHDGAGARLHAAAERRRHAQVDVAADHDHVVLVRERMRGEARLPEEGPVHGAAVRLHGRRPVGADAAGIERGEPRAIERPAGGALRTRAAAPVAHDDGVARPDPLRRRRRPARRRRRPRARTRPDSGRRCAATARACSGRCGRSRRPTSRTRISSARGSSSSTSSRVGGSPAAWVTAAITSDRPVELPARADDAEAVPRAAHGVHRRAQAGRGDAALRVPARRDLRAGRAAAGCPKRRSGRPDGERGARPAPAGRQDQLHRQHARGQPHRRDLRRADQALLARARRQVGGDHPRRRRPRRGDPGARSADDAQQRPGVRRLRRGCSLPANATRRSSRRWRRRSARSFNQPAASLRRRTSSSSVVAAQSSVATMSSPASP